MCQAIWVDGVECETQGELKAALKVDTLPFTSRGAFFGDLQCLCGLDVERLAKDARCAATQHANYMGWSFKRRDSGD